jgi:hypothetical protein
MEKSFLIRFETERTHLESSILNGFQIFRSPIKFLPSTFEVTKVLVEYADKIGRKTPELSWLIDQKKLHGYSDIFWHGFVQKMNSDTQFKLGLSKFLNLATGAEINMKCFTELRDNQKIDTFHTGYFGVFGIALTKSWAIRNGASQVIYVDKDSFLTNALARLFSIYNLSAHTGSKGFSEHALRAFFDVWSLFEIGDHSHEYEWRILGKDIIIGNPTGFEDRPNTLPFELKDILGIFVPSEDINYFRDVLKRKSDLETSSSSIPEVIDIREILLSDQEREIIKNIFTRKK